MIGFSCTKFAFHNSVYYSSPSTTPTRANPIRAQNGGKEPEGSSATENASAFVSKVRFCGSLPKLHLGFLRIAFLSQAKKEMSSVVVVVSRRMWHTCGN